MDLLTCARQVAAQLTAGGVSAAIDPRDLSTPGVLVLPSRIEVQGLSRDWAILTWDLVLIVPSSGGPQHLAELGELMTQVTEITGSGTYETRLFADPALGQELPALVTQITTEEDL